MDEQITGDNDGVDEGMDVVNEEESEDEAGIVHEDIGDDVSPMLLAQLGQTGRSYRREVRTRYKHLVSEIYPRRGSRKISNADDIVIWRQDPLSTSRPSIQMSANHGTSARRTSATKPE